MILRPLRSGTRVSACLAVASLLLVLAGCRGDAEGPTGSSDQSDPVNSVLHVVATGLEDGDGPAVCAHMYREAQVSFFHKYQASDCITAVSAAHEAISANGGVPAMDSAKYEQSDEVVIATGRPAAELAKLLGLPGLYLSEFEGDWTLQGSAEDPAIRGRV